MEVSCESLRSAAAQELLDWCQNTDGRQSGTLVNWPNIYLPVVSSEASSLWPSSTEAV